MEGLTIKIPESAIIASEYFLLSEASCVDSLSPQFPPSFPLGMVCDLNAAAGRSLLNGRDARRRSSTYHFDYFCWVHSTNGLETGWVVRREISRSRTNFGGQEFRTTIPTTLRTRARLIGRLTAGLSTQVGDDRFTHPCFAVAPRWATT